RWGMAASPLLIGGLLVVLVDHWGASYLLGVDAATGAQRWKTPRSASVNWTSPIAVPVGRHLQIVTAGTHWVRGYDAASGPELWKVEGLQMPCIPSPVASGNMVYAVSGRKGDTLAIGLEVDGRARLLWKTPRGAPYVPSPVCHDSLYYMIDDEGIATCLDAATGKRVWQERLRGRYHASLVLGDGKLYYTSMEGIVSVVEAGKQFRLLARNELGEGLVATPALSDGCIFLRGEKHLY